MKIIIILFYFITANLIAQTDSLIPDYRNRINLPKYNKNLMPLQKINVGDGAWTEINPKVPKVDYYGIFFSNKDVGFAVGEFGAIIKTTDEGNTWEDKSFQTEKTLLRVNGIGDNIIIVGVDGIILRSSDAGNNWEQIESGTDANLWKIEMLNDSIGWVCGVGATLLKTTDGGSSWNKVIIPYQYNYWDIEFLDTNIGYISSSYGIVLKTNDGGKTWYASETGDQSELYNIEILNKTNLVSAGASGEIYYSLDSNKTWHRSTLQVPIIIQGLAFADSLMGIGVSTSPGVFQKTIDGGKSWSLERKDIGELDIFFLSDGAAYSVGQNLGIYKSDNAGMTWEEKIWTDDFVDIFPISDSVCYMISNEVLKTSDYGETWTKLDFPWGEKIFFINDSIGFICFHEDILRTTDSGLTWEYVYENSIFTVASKIFFLNETTGFVFQTKKVLKTIDGGINWIEINSGQLFRSGFFLNELLGWTVGEKILETVDGGKTWEEITNLSHTNYFDICFIDSLKGWLLTGNVLYKTTDGCNTWEPIPDITGFYFLQLDNNLFIVWGDQGKVYKSVDGGLNWNIESGLEVYDQFRKVTFKQNTGYAIGNTGLLLTNKNFITGVESKSPEVIKNFYIEDFFPNPFNSQTKTYFITKEIGNIEVKMFDIRGRMLKLILSGRYEAGIHELLINTNSSELNDLSSGIYFIRFLFKGRHESSITKKILYIK